jgi:tetratricopeptide (TPR) repeat protein
MRELADRLEPGMKRASITSVELAFCLAALTIMVGCGMKEEAPKDEVEWALNDARRLAKAGDYAGALEKQVWFHNNALAIRPEYYGVRLSFALADWVELGKKYPPALEKLKSIRDVKVARLSAGTTDRDLFHDVVAINEYLGETKQTVDLFRKIDASNPEFASKVFDLADSALLESGEYQLAKKYLGDPEERLAHAKANFDDGMKWAAEKGGESARRAFEKIFTDEVVGIITILRETGNRESAKKIQSEALVVFNGPAIREALTP